MRITMWVLRWVLARLAAYFAAGVTSSVVLVLWTCCIEISGPMKQAGLLDIMDEGLLAWPYALVMALLLMLLPWCLMIGISGRLPFKGPTCSAISTATVALLAFGIVGGLFPARGHPTFFEGFELAVATSGLPVLVSGAIGGLTYWLCRERDNLLKQMYQVE